MLNLSKKHKKATIRKREFEVYHTIVISKRNKTYFIIPELNEEHLSVKKYKEWWYVK